MRLFPSSLTAPRIVNILITTAAATTATSAASSCMFFFFFTPSGFLELSFSFSDTCITACSKVTVAIFVSGCNCLVETVNFDLW